MARVKYIQIAIPNKGQGLQLGVDVYDSSGKALGRIIGGNVETEFIWAQVELYEEFEIEGLKDDQLDKIVRYDLSRPKFIPEGDLHEATGRRVGLEGKEARQFGKRTNFHLLYGTDLDGKPLRTSVDSSQTEKKVLEGEDEEEGDGGQET